MKRQMTLGLLILLNHTHTSIGMEKSCAEVGPQITGQTKTAVEVTAPSASKIEKETSERRTIKQYEITLKDYYGTLHRKLDNPHGEDENIKDIKGNIDRIISTSTGAQALRNLKGEPRKKKMYEKIERKYDRYLKTQNDAKTAAE